MPICLHTATFVGVVVGFLNVLKYTPAEPPPSRLDIIFDLEAFSVLSLEYFYIISENYF
jgi:hypothetical protein